MADVVFAIRPARLLAVAAGEQVQGERTIDERRDPSRRRHRLMRWLAASGLVGRLRKRVHAWRQPASVEERNVRLLYVQAAFQGLAMGGAMAFVPVYLVRLGAPSWVVGAYTSLPALVMTLSVLPVAAFIQRRVALTPVAAWSRFAFRGGVGLMALLAFLPASVAVYALLAIRCLMGVPAAAMSVSLTAIIGRATQHVGRLTIISRRRALRQIVSASAGFAAGQWLSMVRYPLNYQLLLASALLAGLGTFLALSNIDLPELVEASDGAADAASDDDDAAPALNLRQMAGLMRADPLFARFLAASFLFRFGMRLPMALYPIYRVRTLGSTDAWIGILLTVQRVLQTIAYVALGNLMGEPRNRRWLWVSMIAMVAYPASMALAGTPTMLLLPAAISGLFSAGVWVFLNGMLMRLSPDGQRAVYASLNTFGSQATRFVAPLLGTFLSEVIGIRGALYLSAGMRAVGALGFLVLGVGPGNGVAEEEEEGEDDEE